MAASWNNLGLHGLQMHPTDNPYEQEHDQGAPIRRDDALSSTNSNATSFAHWPTSPQLTTSTTPFINRDELLTPPPPSHVSSIQQQQLHSLNASPTSDRTRSPVNSHGVSSPRSPHFPTSPLNRGHFPQSPSPSNVDPFTSVHAGSVYMSNSSISTGSAPYSRESRARNRSTSKYAQHNIDVVLEHPYYDSPPPSAKSRGENGLHSILDAEATEVPVTGGWRPGWLQKRAIWFFIGGFVVLAVLAEVSVWLGTSQNIESHLSGLWSFLPVAVLSVLAMLWSRVEMQALLYTPWIVLEGRPSTVEETRRKQAHRTILLDYPSMGSFKILAAAFRNRHHLVAASVAVSLLLRVQVVLSTACFYAEIKADGTQIFKAQAPILHVLVVLFVASIGMALPMVYHAPPTRGIAPQNPATMAGIVAMLSSSRAFLSRLSGTGSLDMNLVAARLAGSWYTTELRQPGRQPEELFQLRQLSGGPTMMTNAEASPQLEEGVQNYRPWTMYARTLLIGIGTCIVLLGGLWAIYAIKGNGDGFEVSESAFIVWTCLPTLLFLCLAVFWWRLDIDERRLAPFNKLTTGDRRFAKSLGLSYMNEFGLLTIVKSMKNEDWGVFLKKIVAIAGWLMPIFSAGLFALTELPQTANLHLRQETQFVSSDKSLSGTLDAELVKNAILSADPKYPAWTYQNMAFPKLALTSLPDEWPLPDTDVVADVPGFRADLGCSMATLNGGAGSKFKCTPLGGSKAEAICGNGQAHTALVASSCSGHSSSEPLQYVWGSCADGSTITVMSCKESITTMDVKVSFNSDDLSIDTSNIPLPDTSSEKSSGISAKISSAYVDLDDDVDADGLEGLDGFFRTLVKSQSGLIGMPATLLFQEDRQSSVQVAIENLHSLLGAQVLNAGLIRQSAGNPAPGLIAATLDYYVPRLKQGTTQTYALTGLLAVALAASLLALRTVYRGPATPKSPGSIAAQASLLADSTLWWRIPEGAEWMPKDEMARAHHRKTFRMGWWNNGVGGARTYGIGVVQDEGKSAPSRTAPTVMSRTTASGTLASGVRSQYSGMPETGRYISMAPGVYSYGDMPLYDIKDY